ncbi:MAG: hypothetical protein M3186_03665 [Actinomycetota bacterium]|nr:hypothetical protein [Actinomycetota bacterium]
MASRRRGIRRSSARRGRRQRAGADPVAIETPRGLLVAVLRDWVADLPDQIRSAKR